MESGKRTRPSRRRMKTDTRTMSSTWRIRHVRNGGEARRGAGKGGDRGEVQATQAASLLRHVYRRAADFTAISSSDHSEQSTIGFSFFLVAPGERDSHSFRDAQPCVCESSTVPVAGERNGDHGVDDALQREVRDHALL